MTRWLVDGMNVIGSRPSGWWRDRPAAMRELLAALERFGEATGDELTVVFDGRPFELELPLRHVTVEFARRPGRDAADDDIARLVERDPDPGSLTVATSDADLAERARRGGAGVIGAREFRRRLER